MTSGAATGALGFVFWTLAARGYSTAEVGRASAIISSATLIAILSTLSLGSLYERFLPVAGSDTRRYVRSGLGVVLLAALVFGAVFVVFGPRTHLFTGAVETLLFPIFVMILAVFAVQDQILIGLGRTRTIAAKNIGQSTAKLLAVGAFIPLATGSAIVWAWVLPAAMIAAAVSIRVIRPVSRRRAGEADLPPRGELVHFFVSSYAINAVGMVVPLLVPLIIVARLGTEMNAYFSMCWLVVNTIGVLLNATAAPFIATASAPGADLRACTLRFTIMCGGAAVAGCIGLLLTAPLVLGIMGSEYAAQGTHLIRLMALTLPFLALTTIYVAMSRLQRKLKLAVTVQLLAGCLIVGGIAVSTPIWGIDAVGYSYLATEIVCTLIIIGPTIRHVRRALDAVPPPAAEDRPATPPPAPTERPLEFTSVVEQFSLTAAARQDRTAVHTAAGDISYGELAAAAAHWVPSFAADGRARVILVSSGISPGTVAAVLGVFASDSVLVALDPGLPINRVQTIVDILDEHGWTADTLLTDNPTGELTQTLAPSCQVHSTEIPAAATGPLTAIRKSGVDDITSIQFTSGSAGTPKAVKHGNGMWLCDAQLMHDRFGIDTGRRVALCMPISFGAGLNVLTGSLLNGAEVIAVDPRAESPREAFERIGDTGAQVLVSTPAFLEALCTAAHGDQLPRLDRIITTGEAAHSRHAHRARMLAPNAVFVNWVGSSEASSIATYDIAPGAEIPDGVIPAGIASPHKKIHIDTDGSMSISSRYLALGYLDPNAADSHFVADADGTRTFRGSDIARWDNAGNLILVGRADAAVKIRGYLVEPAEIEAALLRYPEVREATVLAAPSPSENEASPRELIAYLAPSPDSRAPSVADLRTRLHRDLPPWMVPAHIVILPDLPRTERGKVDRQALPPPSRATGTPPRSGLESMIAEVWTEVLQLKEVGRTESFYALGGDSLTVTQMLARISDLHGVRLSHADLASAPTVAQFAATLSDRIDSRVPVHRQRLAPTTVPIRPVPENASGEPHPNPLLCFTGAGASALTFVPLADSTGPDTAVYAFIPNGLENRGVPDWSIGRAARRHLSDLTRLQPHGPYTLVGHSLGGYIALEVAHLLEAAGETVELVVLLDPFLSPGAVRAARQEVPNAVLTLDQNDRLTRRELWRRRLMLPLAGLVHQTGQRQAQALEEVGVRVGLMHRPRPWSGRALLLLSHLNRDDPRLWPYILTGELIIETLPCDHHSIVREPYISAIVELIATTRPSLQREPLPDGV
ncbi:alpha/beta fold hydrolase [Mycobacterium sp. TNTM28]|uniref:Alpha/beta fold hydrolase n=2 Tax=[Mycobacterium] fortunisiensis TaxID=2600579 RepID=A0ABS6KN06_9MYCO|nr:alpha/beta fold hydrolase [[Mycobacterium] fortunisiensis]